jgi:hypothetical protein
MSNRHNTYLPKPPINFQTNSEETANLERLGLIGGVRHAKLPSKDQITNDTASTHSHRLFGRSHSRKSSLDTGGKRPVRAAARNKDPWAADPLVGLSAKTPPPTRTLPTSPTKLVHSQKENPSNNMSSVLDMDRSRTRRERTFIGSQCAVCEEPLEHTLRGERILQFSCTHVSHEACFYEYIKEFESQYCPTCNAPLGLDTSRGGNVLDLGTITPMSVAVLC